MRFGLVFFLLFSTSLFAQQPDTLIQKLDSLSEKADSAGGQINNIKRKAYNERTEITFPSYFVLLASDFKQQVTAPFHVTKKDWGKVGLFAAAAVGLSFADESIQRFGLDLRTHNKGVRNVSKHITNLGAQYEGITLLALGGYGFIFKNEKIQTTTLLATQAYITSGVMHSLLKMVTGRQRPSYYNPDKVEAEPKFRGPFHSSFSDAEGNTISSSFPSGHTTLAFAAATVYAMEYRDRPIIPILSYTAASLVGLSRITENKHWATDIFVGAALGYLTGRQVVNNYHRYAKIKAEKKGKNKATFNLQYNNGVFMPGLVYQFQ